MYVGPLRPPATEKRTTRSDRDAVAEQLSRHYALGSIEYEEFAERLEKVMAARYPSELAELTVDLTSLPPLPTPVNEQAVTVQQAVLDWFAALPRGLRFFFTGVMLLSIIEGLGGNAWALLIFVGIGLIALPQVFARRRGAHKDRPGQPGNRFW